MRRPSVFALAAVLLVVLAGCAATEGWPPGTGPGAAPADVAVRPVAVGQQWVYRVSNVYNGAIEDTITETVVATTPQIRIQRVSSRLGALPEEIQSSWGVLEQDGHWDLPLRYDAPLPAWPTDFTLGRCVRYTDTYRLLADPDSSRRWQLTMTPERWGTATVPAGTFPVLQYDNLIRFVSNDTADVESERFDSVWFAPAVGRWVLRRSHGVHYVPGRGGDMHEAYRQWELVSWK